MSDAVDLTSAQVKTVLSLLKQYLPGVLVWAYGSRVKWTSRPESDLDIVVFVNANQKAQVAALREAFDESNLLFRVDLFVWDEVPENFIEVIKAEHVVLQEKQHEIRAVGSGWGINFFDDVVDINPTRKLSKETDSIYISMQQLEPHNRGVNTLDRRIYKGSGSRFKKGDTLLARITPCLENGKTAYVDFLKQEEVAHGSTEFIILSGIEGISDNLFVYYLARTPKFRNFAIGQMEGSSGRQRVPASTLKRYKFACPPLLEQQAIAHILGTLDDKIELNRQMNETLEAMAKAIFKSWFVDFDPVHAKAKGQQPIGMPPEIAELFPDSFEGSELGQIPKGWKVIPIGKAVKAVGGATPSTKEPVFWESGIHQWATGTTFAEISKKSFRPIPMLVPNKDIMDKFTLLVEPFYKNTVFNLHENNILSTLRDKFLPKLISGEIRIKDADKFVEEIV